MIFSLLDQLQFDPLGAILFFIYFAIALIIGITVHEFSHALVATRLGDFTARRLGRLTLNPRAHLDPLGTLLIVVGGFGWGRPTPVSPANLRIGIRPGMAAVSLAGPASNVIVAAFFALPIRLGLISGFGGGIAADLIQSVIFWNLLLASFNLIPISPLDGFKIALGVLPENMAESFARTERYGPVILLFVIMADVAFNIGILSRIIFPILNALRFVVLGGNV